MGFTRYKTVPWRGRYARIPGETSVFHLRRHNNGYWPVVDWYHDGCLGNCFAVDCPEARGLAQAVSAGKKELGGNGGGTFIINEFGYVLVPSSDGKGRRVLVGRLTGRLLFQNPFKENSVIDISNPAGMKTGDRWERPYVGVPFKISGRGKIYFVQQQDDGEEVIYPDHQDRKLINALRLVRSEAGARFIVNPYGLVLTKKQINSSRYTHGEWVPVYVGKINPNFWFPKEVR